MTNNTSQATSTFKVLLIKSGQNKPAMMMAVREINPRKWTALKAAKDFIDNPPGYVIEGITYEQALAAIQTLEKVGAKAELEREIDLN